MIKKTIYPKTNRVPVNPDWVCELTEKLDGSNLVIFKYKNVLYFAQRNTIYTADEVVNADKKTVTLYKGLKQWVIDNRDYLEENLFDNMALCGEWLGMGAIKYAIEDGFDKRFYMFAKASVTKDYTLINKTHYQSMFCYAFKDHSLPSFIGVVPLITTLNEMPDKEDLDIIYTDYSLLKTHRFVEGIVVNYQNNISKYVRMKCGKLQEHTDRY